MLLTESNYIAWKSFIKKRLDDEGLWNYTIGAQTTPGHQDQTKPDSDLDEFKKKSRLAFYFLIKSIDDSVIFSVSALDFENNPSELWNVLQLKYQPNELYSKFEAFKKFRSIEFDENDPEQFIDSIRSSFAQLDEVGFNFDEPTCMVLCLSQLPAQIVGSILPQPGSAQGFTDLGPASIKSCQNLFEKLRSLPIQQPNPRPTQVNHHHHRESQDLQSNSADPDSSSTTRIVLSCSKCNRKGHEIQHCWKAHPELRPKHNAKNLASSQASPSPVTSNGRNSTVNSDHDVKAKNFRSRLAPHQAIQSFNDQNLSSHQTNGDWNNSYKNTNNSNYKNNNNNNNNNKDYHSKKENHSHQNRDQNNNNGLFKKTIKKTFRNHDDDTFQSSKWNVKVDQSDSHQEETGRGEDNKENQKNVQVPSSGWTLDQTSLNHKTVAGSGWTEDVANFETSAEPPNQWSCLGDQQ